VGFLYIFSLLYLYFTLIQSSLSDSNAVVSSSSLTPSISLQNLHFTSHLHDGFFFLFSFHHAYRTPGTRRLIPEDSNFYVASSAILYPFIRLKFHFIFHNLLQRSKICEIQSVSLIILPNGKMFACMASFTQGTVEVGDTRQR